MSMAVCGFIITFPGKASLRSAVSRPAETEAKMTGVRPGTHTLAEMHEQMHGARKSRSDPEGTQS